MRLAYYILVLFFSFACVTGNAQQPLYRNFTDEDGLPSNTVYQIFQDPKGYLWMTTTKGICRFDGAEFVKIPLEGLQTEDMPIAAMDSYGRLWAANLAGQLIYIEDLTSIVVKVKELSPSSTIQSIEIRDNILNIKILELNSRLLSNSYYVINKNDLVPLFKQTSLQKRKNYSVAQVLSLEKVENKVTAIYELVDDLVVSEDFDLNDLKYYRYKLRPSIFFQLDTCRNCFLRTVKAANKNHSKMKPVGPFKNMVVSSFVFISPSEVLLLDQQKKVYIYNLDNHFVTEEKQLSDIRINHFFIDKNDNYWVISESAGIFLLHKNDIQLFNLLGDKHLSIKKLAKINDVLYIGCQSGQLSTLNLSSDETAHILANDGPILNFTETSEGDVYVINNYINILPKGQAKLNRLFRSAGIKSLYRFQNTIYYSASFGIVLCNDSNLNLFAPTSSKFLLNIRSYTISERNDTVLLGTTKGLYGYAHDSVFQFKGFKQPELYITKLYVDTSKTIWICTDGKGLLAYNHSKDIQYFGLKEGLPSLNCSDIVQIDKRRYAVGTDKGLWIFDKVTKSSFLFDKLDGLKSNEITALVSDGTYLWVGTTKGLVKCEIASLQPNPEIPFVEITTAQYEHDGKFSPLAGELSYQQNHVCFYLSSRSLLAGKKRNYAYRLVGLDTNWVRTSEQKIEFLGLQPGKYRFEVRVFNEDGIGSDDRTFHEFTISPPWWKTTLFYVSVILFLITLALAIGYSYVRNMRKKLQAQYEIKSQINEFKQLALQSQMNPHFIFNSLNAIQSYLSTSDELTAMHFLAKFGRLIRIIFEQSKHKLISIDQEVEGLQHYLDLEKLRFKDKVEYRLYVDPELRARDFMIPPLMVQPIVENSFRHGLFHKKDGIGLLEISFNLVGGRLRCLVRDNGIGRDNSRKINAWKTDDHLSSAISNTSDRLRILDDGTGNTYMIIKDLVDESGQPCGTETIIQF